MSQLMGRAHLVVVVSVSLFASSCTNREPSVQRAAEGESPSSIEAPAQALDGRDDLASLEIPAGNASPPAEATISLDDAQSLDDADVLYRQREQRIRRLVEERYGENPTALQLSSVSEEVGSLQDLMHGRSLLIPLKVESVSEFDGLCVSLDQSRLNSWWDLDVYREGGPGIVGIFLDVVRDKFQLDPLTLQIGDSLNAYGLVRETRHDDELPGVGVIPKKAWNRPGSNEAVLPCVLVKIERVEPSALSGVL